MSKTLDARRTCLSWLLAGLLCFSALPVTAFADEGAVNPSDQPVALDEGSTGPLGDGEGSGTEAMDDETASELAVASSTDDNSASPLPDEETSGDLSKPGAPSAVDGETSIDAGEAPATSYAAAQNDETEGHEIEAAPKAPLEQPSLGFVYIDEVAPVVGEQQSVAFALSDEGACLTQAVLCYATLQGKSTVAATKIEGNGALFAINLTTAGEYQLLAVEFSVEGSEEVFCENLDARECSFDVQEKAADSGIAVTALALNDDGQLVEANDTEEAIEEAVASTGAPLAASSMVRSVAPAAARATSYAGIVVALDPGHGGSDSGATGNGLLEKNLTLSIAKYCQAALERQGIKVFITRSTDISVGLAERVEKAAAAGATVFVSIHINSASPTAHGCEVWVPNGSSYNYDVHTVGKALGERIQAKLVALGLYNRGVKERDTENKSKYPDGSLSDYYSVIRNSRLKGIPGIIIEHAFISNKEDALKMSSDAFLKKLGEADAQGIIEAIDGGAIKVKGQAQDCGLYNDGKGYRFKTADGLESKNSWVTVNGKRYYFGPDGYAVRWGQKIGGSWYYFNAASQMQTGWVTWVADGLKSYYGADGRALTGWQTVGGKRYYFDPATGKSVRWSRKIDGSWYYFNAASQMQTGVVTWIADGLKSIYGADGRRLTGWQTYSGKRYYIDPATGKSVRWGQKIGGSWYYFNAASQMQTGWVTWVADGLKSYYGADGRALTGWQTVGGKRYYFDPATGKSVRWSREIDGSWYYFNAASQMQTGWVTWVADGSKSYFDPADGGAMLIGEATVDGVSYDFGEDGKIRNKVMGAPQTTVAAMVADYKAHGKSYPSAVYASKGAPTLEDFCRLIYEEATAEGVRPAVLYAQVMLETGWLQFNGGSVKPDQCNFGGIGATDSNPKPATFENVRMGLRAQVQHLKAYATKDALVNPCIDPRFHLVNRGVAPYVADLAGRWASDKEYGVKLNKLIDNVCKA